MWNRFSSEIIKFTVIYPNESKKWNVQPIPMNDFFSDSFANQYSQLWIYLKRFQKKKNSHRMFDFIASKVKIIINYSNDLYISVWLIQIELDSDFCCFFPSKKKTESLSWLHNLNARHFSIFCIKYSIMFGFVIGGQIPCRTVRYRFSL